MLHPRARQAPWDALVAPSNRFEVRTFLASGGMGDVVLAHDRVRSCDVALKLARLGDDHMHFARCVAGLQREADVLRRLEHPSIVAARDYLVLPEADVLVLDYVPAPTLTRARCHSRRTLRIGLRICDALAHVHARGFVHLDLKAENLLVSETGEVWLIDFGIAQPFGPLVPLVDGLPAVVGTPVVMSPEQLAGDRVDGRSDLFSLGVLLYELLSGRSPFAAPPHAEDVGSALTVGYTPLGDVEWGLPLELTMLVDQLLCFDPAARPQTAQEVAARLCDGFAGMGVRRHTR